MRRTTTEMPSPPALALASSEGRQLAPSALWKLQAGQAATLRVRQTGALHVKRGQVWATFENAQADGSARAGDHFLARGQRLALRAGQKLVVESLGASPGAAAFFSWEPLAA